jgi:hypothetical protein
MGSSHQSTATPCQDRYRVAPLANGFISIAVADGAGSAKWGGEGAEIAISAAHECIAAGLEDIQTRALSMRELLREAILAATAAIEERVPPGGACRDYATTLQLLVAGPEQYGYIRVGDGGCVIRDPVGDLVVVSPRPRNVFVNETEFVTSGDINPEVIIGERISNAVAVFTDGLQPVAMNIAEWLPHKAFFNPLFDYARRETSLEAAENALTTFLSGERLNSRTDDDRTLVFAVWCDE